MSELNIIKPGVFYEYTIRHNSDLVAYKKPNEDVVIIDAKKAIEVLLQRIGQLDNDLCSERQKAYNAGFVDGAKKRFLK